MLGVDIDEPVSQDFKFLQGDYTVVHERAAFTVGVQFATDDAFIKLRLDDTFVFAVGDGFAVRACTEHQGQRPEDDTLTGTGFTCEHREPALEIDVQMADQRVVLYV